MSKLSATQARGIFTADVAEQARPASRLLVFTGDEGGAGRTKIAAALAVAIARRQRSVLLVQCRTREGAAIRTDSAFTLVVSGEKTIEQIAQKGPAGIDVVPAFESSQPYAQLAPWQRERLARQLAASAAARKFTLIACAGDTLPTAGIIPAIAPWPAGTVEAVAVATPDGESLAAAYAEMKRLALATPRTRVSLLVNAARDADEAERTYRGLAGVARKFIGAAPGFFGWVPAGAPAARPGRRSSPLLADPAAEAVDAIAARICAAAQQMQTAHYIGLGT